MRIEPDIVKELRKIEQERLQNQPENILEFQEKQETENIEEKTVLNVLNDGVTKNNKANGVMLGSVEDKYRIIFENYTVGITLVDEKERIVSWNKYAEELFNMNEQDLYLKHVKTLYPPQEWKKIRKHNIRQKGMKYKLETKMIRKGKEPFDAEISLSILKGVGGKVTGSVGIIRDITKLKITERKLIESEEKYRTIFENSAVAIMLTDQNENIISWNKYTEKLLDMKKEDLYMKPVKSFYPEKEWKKIRSHNVRQKGMQHHLETKMKKKNNMFIDVDISLSVLKNHEGKIIGSIGVIRDITKRKLFQKRLKDSEEKYRTIFDNSAVAIMLTDEDEKIISWNKYTEKMLKMNKTDLYKKHVKSLYHPDEWKKIRKQNVRKKGMQHHLETQILRKNKEPLEVDISLSVLKDYEGNIIGSIGVIKDITEIKKAENIVKKSEKRYRKLFETAIDPIIVLDEKGVYIDINEQFTKLLGYNKKDLIGKPFDKTKLLKNDSLKKTKENFKKRMKGKKITPYEIQILTKKGEKIPLEVNASSLYEDNKTIGDLIILRDLREKIKIEKAEKELSESERKFREIFNATSDLLLYIDINGSIIDVNKTALQLSSLKKNKLIGKDLTVIKNLFSEEDLKKHIESVQETAKGEEVKEYEGELVTKDDLNYRFLFSTDVIKKGEKINGVLFRGRDITQRQRAWTELVKLEEKYRVLAETSADGVITVDSLGRLTYVNPSFENICGSRKSQILATLFTDYLSDDSIVFFQKVFKDVKKNENKVENVELELFHTDGTIVPIDVNIAPLKKGEKFVGVICTIRDITERKKVEEELKKSERLKTEFMNIAAHELKSPVTPIKGYLDLIISDNKTDDNIRDWAKISQRNVERLLRLVNDILDVSRLDTDTMKFNMEKWNPAEMINEIAEDMKPVITNKGLEFIVHIPKNLPDVIGDRYRLSQVLKNLLDNAIKFTDNGSIAIIVKKENKHILISVEDSGVGISKGELKNIFTKFYQAYTGDDRKNEGTGLGLFICKQIVEKHKGKIWVESDIRQGSTFTFKIPHL